MDSHFLDVLEDFIKRQKLSGQVSPALIHPDLPWLEEGTFWAMKIQSGKTGLEFSSYVAQSSLLEEGEPIFALVLVCLMRDLGLVYRSNYREFLDALGVPRHLKELKELYTYRQKVVEKWMTLLGHEGFVEFMKLSEDPKISGLSKEQE